MVCSRRGSIGQCGAPKRPGFQSGGHIFGVMVIRFINRPNEIGPKAWQSTCLPRHSFFQLNLFILIPPLLNLLNQASYTSKAVILNFRHARPVDFLCWDPEADVIEKSGMTLEEGKER